MAQCGVGAMAAGEGRRGSRSGWLRSPIGAVLFICPVSYQVGEDKYGVLRKDADKKVIHRRPGEPTEERAGRAGAQARGDRWINGWVD